MDFDKREQSKRIYNFCQFEPDKFPMQGSKRNRLLPKIFHKLKTVDLQVGR